MRKEEFLNQLGKLLSGLPTEQIKETKQFYAEAIADRMEDGMNEQEAVPALGAPETIAKNILANLPAIPRAIVKTRRRSNVLLWTLVIMGSPLWFALLLAFAVTAFTIYLAIWALALCVWLIALGLAASSLVALALVVTGISIGNIPYALAMLGCGLGMLGVTLLIGAGAWVVSKQIARLSALWAKKALSPFWKNKSDSTGEEHFPFHGGPAEKKGTSNRSERFAFIKS